MTVCAFVGDSVTAESRANAWASGQGWAALASNRIGASRQNFSVSAATTTQMQSQWNVLLAMSPLPDMVAVMAGENDIPVTPVASFKSTLYSQVSAAILAGIPASKITLLTPFIYPPSSYLYAAPTYLQAIRDIGASLAIPVVDVFDRFTEFGYTRSDFSSLYNPDGHPTIAGHVEIANMFNLVQNAGSSLYTANPILPVNQIPVMTAATTNGVTMTGNNLDSVGGSGYPIWELAADPPQTIQWNQVGSAAMWVEVDFPASFVASSYKIGVRPDANAQAYSPRSWVFLGSNDGVSWTAIDTQTNVGSWQQGEVREFPVGGASAYSRYKMSVSASETGSTNTYLHIHSIQILK